MVLSLSLLLVTLALVLLGFLWAERARIRRALAEQRWILESTFSGAASGMAIVDLSGRWVSVNRALCEMSGYPEHELLKRSVGDLTYPDDRPATVAAFRRLVAGEIRSYQLQKRYVHRSGHLFWALISCSLVRDEQGRPFHCVVHVQEITDYHREFEALSRRERQSAWAQELAKLASWEWDLVADRVTWSDAVFQAFGASPETFEPSLDAYLALVHPEDRELIMTSLDRAREAHHPFALDQRVTGPDGRPRIVHIKGEAVVGSHGEAVALRGSVQDVTEIRQALDEVLRQAEESREVSALLRQRNSEVERQIVERDQELEARDRMFQRIVQHVPAAIAYFDRHHACQWLNPEALARFGIAAEEVSRLSARDVPLFGRAADHFGAVLALGEPYRESGVPLCLRDGEKPTYWDYSLIPCRDADGEPEGLLAFGREVTLRQSKVMQQQQQIAALEASEALKDRFLNTLSHEIRSPLTVILGAAMLFQGEALGPLTEKQHRFVAKLLRNGRELLRMVNNVLEANLLRSQRMVLLPEPIPMEELVRELVAEFQASAAMKGQVLIEELDGGLPRVRGDRRKLTQVWLNLLANAVQYAPEGATIAVRLRQDGETLRAEVFNPGSPIPPERLEAIISSWQHLGNETHGLGLGLGLSKALVEAHGGQLGVRSQPEGVTAWFTVPLEGPAELGDGPLAAPVPGPR